MSSIDIRLKAALKEIEKIVHKYELGATISLHSKTHGEYKLIIPTWAVFTFDFDPKGGQFKFHVSHDKKHGDNIQSSYAFLLASRDVCQSHVNLVTTAINKLVEQKALIFEQIPASVVKPLDWQDLPEGHPI